MKKFIVTVNGHQYEVEVEEVGAVQPAAPVTPVVTPAAQAAPAPAQAAATEAPKAEAPKPAPAPAASAPAGAVKVNAPIPGTILDIKVNPGDRVKRGDILLILEAMKMENEILAPQDGTVAAIHVSKGTTVNSGDLLVSLN